MSPDADVVPSRGRGGWDGAARLHAATQLRDRLNAHTSVLATAEAGAEYFRTLLKADTVTVSTYLDGRYRDLVNAGYLPAGEVRFPSDSVYPDTLYPVTTEELRVHGGYFSVDTTDAVFKEWVAAVPRTKLASILGVGIVSGGSLRGEVCATRHDVPGFDRDDFDLARDLATTLGSRLMMAIRRAAREDNPQGL